MIRAIVLFLVLSALIFLAIFGIQKMSGKQALALTKIAFYSIISSSVAVALMFALVEIF